MQRAPRNRTITLTAAEEARLAASLLRLESATPLSGLVDRIIHQENETATPLLPCGFVDLLILDPPYNMDKRFGNRAFRATSDDLYGAWVESWFEPMLRLLKPNATVYFCGDWRSSSSVQRVLDEHLCVRNRITWEREKGRGALANWKNCSEDIWFATVSDEYTFNVDAVKLKRRVLAPYRDAVGAPKDWSEGFRLTHPSNLWTDLTVPFWSMPENTDHPTQKPEKLIAKLILASSNPGDILFDPFLGSGTTAVVAKKLGRRFVGVEADAAYCSLAQKRLELAEADRQIQGLHNGVFYERNSKPATAARESGWAMEQAELPL